MPDVVSHLSDADRQAFDDLLRTALLELEQRRLAALQRRPQNKAFQPHFANPGEQPISLGQVSDDFLKERFSSKNVPEKRQNELKAEAGLIQHLFGRDLLVSRIDREGCRNFRDTLNKLPSNISKHFPKYQTLDLKDLIAETNRKSLPRMKNGTQNKYIALFKAILAFAVSEGHIRSNPFPLLQALGEKTPPRRARNSFNTEDLNKIFSTAQYVDPVHPRREVRYWAPLLGLFTGMRLNEICQLDIEDVRQGENQIWYIDVNDDADDKSVKNEGSYRQLPIHPELIRLGFEKFVSGERAHRRAGKLFEGIRKRSDGNYGHDLSKWFNRTFLKNAEVKTSKKSFHSFRHSFRDALRNAKVHPEFADAFGGWNVNRHGVSGNYGDGPSLSEKAKEIEKISYAHLDLSHLYNPEIK